MGCTRKTNLRLALCLDRPLEPDHASRLIDNRLLKTSLETFVELVFPKLNWP